MKKALMTVSVFLLTLAACGTEESSEESEAVSVDEINMEQLEVEVEAPGTLEEGEEAEIRALVTQGEEPVDDADEVVFEIWINEKKEESDMVEADLPGEEGQYNISYTFETEGHYRVQPHTTARGMHVMPVHEITVGDADPETEEEEHESHSGNKEVKEDFTVDWRAPETGKPGEEMSLTASASYEEESWTGGDVRYEIWKHGDEIREWVDAEEKEEGVYEASHTFEEPGEYHVVLHAEDDQLHEHLEYFLEIRDE